MNKNRNSRQKRTRHLWCFDPPQIEARRNRSEAGWNRDLGREKLSLGSRLRLRTVPLVLLAISHSVEMLQAIMAFIRIAISIFEGSLPVVFSFSWAMCSLSAMGGSEPPFERKSSA